MNRDSLPLRLDANSALPDYEPGNPVAENIRRSILHYRAAAAHESELRFTFCPERRDAALRAARQNRARAEWHESEAEQLLSARPLVPGGVKELLRVTATRVTALARTPASG
jgi:hypothetical protein